MLYNADFKGGDIKPHEIVVLLAEIIFVSYPEFRMFIIYSDNRS